MQFVFVHLSVVERVLLHAQRFVVMLQFSLWLWQSSLSLSLSIRSCWCSSTAKWDKGLLLLRDSLARVNRESHCSTLLCLHRHQYQMFLIPCDAPESSRNLIHVKSQSHNPHQIVHPTS